MTTTMNTVDTIPMNDVNDNSDKGMNTVGMSLHPREPYNLGIYGRIESYSSAAQSLNVSAEY